MFPTTLAALLHAATASSVVNAAVIIAKSDIPTPATVTSSISRPTAVEPCAIVSQSAEAILSAHPEATRVAVAPSIAYKCLKSVPVYVERDVQLIEYLIPYIEQQSTLAWLKNPPKGYLLPGVDVLGGLNEMKKKLQHGGYGYQYEFVVDLRNIFIRAHDGHFFYTPALASVFSFQIPYELVSLSEDGVGLPKVYSLGDVVYGQRNSSYTHSDIDTIAGVPAAELLEEAASDSWSQDPDSLYNGLFSSIPMGAAGRGSSFTSSDDGYSILPDAIDLVFSNGSTYTITTKATFDPSLFIDGGVDTGAKLHWAAEVPKATSTVKKRAETTTYNVNPTVVGYPYPVIKHSGDYIAGYFLNGSEYTDTAVLSIFSFDLQGDPKSDLDPKIEFRNVIEAFLAECKSAGKKKLVIDLQANGGGLIASGYELFQSLFPHIYIENPQRQRATDLLQAWGTINGVLNTVGDVVDESGVNFTDWDAFFGPETVYDDKFTASYHFNLSSAADWGYVIQDPTDPASPFTAENIVIVTDGICASTCTIFTGLATRLAGVRTIAMGGRPLEAPMQAMGGTKGSNIRSWKSNLQDISKAIIEAYQDANETLPVDVNNLPSPNDPPLLPLISDHMGVNYRDQYLNASHDVPVQFVYEAANCKQFYTVETLFNMTRLWETAHDIAWSGAKCVAGSSAGKDGTISDKTMPWTKDVVSANSDIRGPGAVAVNLGTQDDRAMTGR